MLLFSGHDTNLAALLGALELYDPPFMLSYGSALLFELHKAEEAVDGKRSLRRRRMMEGEVEVDEAVGAGRRKRRMLKMRMNERITDGLVGRITGRSSSLFDSTGRAYRGRSEEAQMTKNMSPENLIVKLYLLEGIHNKSAVLKRLRIPGCDGESGDDRDGSGSGGDSDCRLSQLIKSYKDVAVWSETEFMQLCNGINRLEVSHFIHFIAFALLQRFFLIWPL